MTLSPEMVTESSSLHTLEVSVIIPVYNEQNKISDSLSKIKQAVETVFLNYELIVVNDGSTDETLTILKEVESADPHITVLSYTPNRGKGYAVRQGVLHSHGNAVVLLDGDLDISPDSIRDYVERLSISDLVVGSKRHPGSNITIPKSRAFLSRAFNILIKLTTGIPQKDTQVGFKVGNGEIMRTIFGDVSIKRYAFDVELFMIASILHLRIHEMPVMMKIDRRFNLKEIVNMFMDVTRISYKYRIAHHYHHKLRIYSKPSSSAYSIA